MKINTTSYGIKISLSSIILLLTFAFYQLNYPLFSYLLIIIILLVLTSQSGIEFNNSSKIYRSFITYLGYKKGEWKNLDKYVGIVIISGKGSKRIYGFYQTSSINKKENIHQVYLVTNNHLQKIKIATESNLNNAEKLANRISKEINIPITKFNPKPSQKNLKRRSKR